MKVAVIDMGSNSFRLQVSEVFEGSYKVVEDYKEILRVGDDVYTHGSFSEATMGRIIETLKRMSTIISGEGVSHCRLVGTAPFRDAKNANLLLDRIKSLSGYTVDIISGDEEARLIYLSATSYFDLNDTGALFVDIGGGSAELSYTDKGQLTTTLSTPLGCSRLTKKFFKKDKAKPEELARLKKHIEKTLRHLPEDKPERIVFTGGTANAIAQVFAKRANMADTVVKFVDGAFLTHFINELAGKNYETRAKIAGLESGRADIALACAIIVQHLVKYYNMTGFYSFSGGLRNGVTIDLLNSLGLKMLFQDNRLPDLRYSRLIETGRKFNFEEDHALQVLKLSKKLFGALCKYLKLSAKDWYLLEAAAILHDVGQHIGYAKHHRHSYYLIRNSELVGYTDRENSIVANVARYHRRGTPSAEDVEYAELTRMERQKVNKLAAILRVADGLDRSHTASVQDIEVNVEERHIKLSLTVDRDISMELAGVDKKKGMLEKFGKELKISV